MGSKDPEAYEGLVRIGATYSKRGADQKMPSKRF